MNDQTTSAGRDHDDTEPTLPLTRGGATVADVPPEVTRFVGKVRQQLSDLDPETQDELLDGLVADLSDRVAEDGPEALGDPTAYAGELRAAAGLPTRARVRVPSLPGRGRGRGRERTALHGVGPRLDAAHSAWDRLLARQSVLTPALLETLRPAWWVLRAWILVQAVAAVFGGRAPSVVPSVQGPVLGGVVLVVAVLASVQIGRGLVWPGTSSATGPRVALLVGNLAAVGLALPVLAWMQSSAVEPYYDDGYVEAVPVGLSNDGNPVYNVFAYDAQGRPLTGVQLFDQDGRRLSAGHEDYTWYTGDGESWIKTYPWRNGFAPLWNVYPRPQQEVPEYSDREPAAPALPNPPLGQVPPATLPTSDASGPGGTSSPSASPSAVPSTISSASPGATVSPSAPPS